ncbi:MAG TPA: MEDS domain-containing protein [Candidatus Limnocylindrales bacterium]
MQVPESRDFGLAGVDLVPGDHICAMYLGRAERDNIVLPYLRAGLRAGDKCLCIIDSSPLGDLLADIGEKGEVDGYVASRQLELHTAHEAYLRTPPFSTEAMLEYWELKVGAAVTDDSFGFARVTGEMPWEMRLLPGRTEFFRYEGELNRFALRYPQAILCLYDLDRFGGGILVDLLRTHPKLLMGGLVLENPHYRPPDDLAATA